MAMWWEIAKVAVPIAAGVVGTPAAGVAVSAAMQGADARAKGGSWSDAGKAALIGGGLSAATAGMGGGAAGAGQAMGQAAGAGAGQAMSKAAQEALARELAAQTGEQFATNLGTQLGAEGMNLGAQQMIVQSAAEAAKTQGITSAAQAQADKLQKYGNYATEASDLLKEFRGGTQQMLGPQQQQGGQQWVPTSSQMFPYPYDQYFRSEPRY